MTSESSTHHASSTGLRRALRSRVSRDVFSGYLQDSRLNPSYKFATLPRNFRRSLVQNENSECDARTTPTSNRFATNPRFFETLTLPRKGSLCNDSFESANNSLVSRKSVGSDSEILDDSPEIRNRSFEEPKLPHPPFNSPNVNRKHSLAQRDYRPAFTPRLNAVRKHVSRIVEVKYNSNYDQNNKNRIDLRTYEKELDSDSSVEML